jgi:hypothetical protein
MKTIRQYHVGEVFAAGLSHKPDAMFLFQYGANQPEYNLMITRARRAIHVSVKGSQDGAWDSFRITSGA